MTFAEKLDSLWQTIGSETKNASGLMERIRSEIDICQRFAAHRPAQAPEWEPLIVQALEGLAKDTASESVDLRAAVERAEKTLAPIGAELKNYTIHCCGHAHIDMNWLWPWQETVSTSRDTFSTVDRLMEAFPEFHFSQDQTSTYVAMQEYCPEVFDAIKRRVAEGRWDVTASTWVEGEKNLASGEILCRQMLYTRRYLKENLGLPYDHVKIDWEPDMFGHAHTLPAILNRGGVTRYYFCRGGKEPKLFWWQAPDGSRVLAYLDNELWYNGTITPDMTRILFKFEKQAGVKDFLFLYGVGDHGGGPTRRDLVKLGEMKQWPIYPTLRQGNVGDFYDAVEAANPDLPVIDDELNFVFEGCYTSQSLVKRGNRMSENELPKAETIALIAGALDGMPYPGDDLLRGWRHAMFCQFHDILPGSGVHATYEYASGLFQEVKAITESVSVRGLRRLASRINTAAVAGTPPAADGRGADLGDGLGAGAGDPALPGGVTGYNAGAPGAQPFLVYNPMGFARSEVALAKVWNVDWPDDRIRVKDDKGNAFTGQVVGRGDYWGHKYITVAFPAAQVPAVGYRVFAIDRAAEPVGSEGVTAKGGSGTLHSETAEESVLTLENDQLRMDVESASGAIIHLVDKQSGFDFVPAGERMGLLELYEEAPHGMTAWVIGQISKVHRFEDGGTLTIGQRGPHRASVVSRRTFQDSTFTLEISLDAGSRQVSFSLNADWLERGTPQKGVPMLRVAFPVAVSDTRARYEVPFGSIQRDAKGNEVPALKWADLSGKGSNGEAGITLVNENKYGHNADDNMLRLTLLRSSYDPDPLPELGNHQISFAIEPHMGRLAISDAMRTGWAFNSPLTVISTEAHGGELETTKGFVSVEPGNVMLASVKKAEDSGAVILRLFEMEGKKTDTRVRIHSIVKPDAAAVECDLLEQPLAASTAVMEDGTLRVTLPPHGITTVKLG